MATIPTDPRDPEGVWRHDFAISHAERIARDVRSDTRPVMGAMDSMQFPVGASARDLFPSGPVPVIFDSLLSAVSALEPKSAVCVAYQIALEKALDEREIEKLLQDLQLPDKPERKDVDLDAAKNEKALVELQREIQKAKLQYAMKLRGLGLVDVDIVYDVERHQPYQLQEDKVRIRSMEGVVYNFLPQKPLPGGRCQMVITAVSKQDVLDVVYPANKREALGITIKTNTEPAAPCVTSSRNSSDQPVPLAANGSFPHRASDRSDSSLFTDPTWEEHKATEVRKRTEALVEKIEWKPRNPVRSDTWHPFNDSVRVNK